MVGFKSSFSGHSKFTLFEFGKGQGILSFSLIYRCACCPRGHRCSISMAADDGYRIFAAYVQSLVFFLHMYIYIYIYTYRWHTGGGICINSHGPIQEKQPKMIPPPERAPIDKTSMDTHNVWQTTNIWFLIFFQECHDGYGWPFDD